MRLIRLLIAIALCMSLTVVVSAHSGRTDSNGGHYDQSTGDYHYHHGYSAHDHYDIDGDGDLDCPYEFNGTTNNQNRRPNKQTNSQPRRSFFDKFDKQNEAPTEESSDIYHYAEESEETKKSILHHIWDLICSFWDVICKLLEIGFYLLCVAAVIVVIEKIWEWIKGE